MTKRALPLDCIKTENMVWRGYTHEFLKWMTPFAWGTLGVVFAIVLGMAYLACNSQPVLP